jgi:hypothetical protein
MKYMIIISHNQQAMESWSQMSESDRALGFQAHEALHDDLNSSGEMVVAEVLADASQAKRVLVSAGRTSTVDGPVPDSGGHLAGFYLVDCDNMERAVEWAARIPEAAFGLVEVRPVR